tara:strand:- start:1698 stop:2288 length:591 start_codon:yes stop_codon:yes gene_type:complete
MEEEIKESNSLHDLKEEFVESDIAAAIENDEVNNEEIQNSNEVDPMDKLSYADGKERDEIDEKEAEEKLMGADKISPFGTNDTMVFKRKLERMDFSQKAHLAHRVAARVFADQELQDESLVRAFHEWRSSNWGSTGGRTAEKAQVLASDSISDFEQNLKGKTLSELQEMAMKLGFTPSYDRIRLTSALRQEYLKRG